MRVSRSEVRARDWIQRERAGSRANAMSSSRAGTGPGAASVRTNRREAGWIVTPGIAGFQRLAGARAGSSATLRGPVRRS